MVSCPSYENRKYLGLRGLNFKLFTVLKGMPVGQKWAMQGPGVKDSPQ